MDAFLTAAVEALDKAGYEVTDMDYNWFNGSWEFIATNVTSGTANIHFTVTANYVYY